MRKSPNTSRSPTTRSPSRPASVKSPTASLHAPGWTSGSPPPPTSWRPSRSAPISPTPVTRKAWTATSRSSPPPSISTAPGRTSSVSASPALSIQSSSTNHSAAVGDPRGGPDRAGLRLETEALAEGLGLAAGELDGTMAIEVRGEAAALSAADELEAMELHDLAAVHADEKALREKVLD